MQLSDGCTISVRCFWTQENPRRRLTRPRGWGLYSGEFGEDFAGEQGDLLIEKTAAMITFVEAAHGGRSRGYEDWKKRNEAL